MNGRSFPPTRRVPISGPWRPVAPRLIILLLVALLVVPASALTPPDPMTPSWDSSTAVAKNKKGKKGKKKDQPNTPTYTIVTRTLRQPVTQTFANTGTILVPVGAPEVLNGPASPYPSAIHVSGFPAGSTITDVNLILNDLSHGDLSDIDILLARSDQTTRNALVLSDGRGGSPVDIDLTLDDEATATPVLGAWTSGTYQPTNVTATAPDLFFDGPTPSGDVALSTFDGGNPNGTWELWVRDDSAEASTDFGDIGGGWALQISAEHDVQVQEQVPVPTKDKQKKKGKRRR